MQTIEINQTAVLLLLAGAGAVFGTWLAKGLARLAIGYLTMSELGYFRKRAALDAAGICGGLAVMLALALVPEATARQMLAILLAGGLGGAAGVMTVGAFRLANCPPKEVQKANMRACLQAVGLVRFINKW